MAKKLFTLLQVSDLHIGRLMPDGSAPLPSAVLQFAILEGMLGHHYTALTDLERFYARERVRSPELEIAVTGDLTADGSPDQFDLAASFLAHNGGPGFGFGLGASAWRDRSVSGNHDQWGGVGHPFGASVSRLRYHFSKPFPQVDVVDLPDGSAIEFILVDSDSDVPQRGHERLFARGRFHRQLDYLEGRLAPPTLDRIRVLVLHHALSIDPGPAPAGTEPFPLRPWNPLRRLEIQRGTMERLERMVAKCRIQIILTGHVHTPRLSVFAAQGSGGPVEVMEARCGTTTQRDRYSLSQRRKIRTGPPHAGAPPAGAEQPRAP